MLFSSIYQCSLILSGILQDDLDDWSKIAATMADIYRNAYLTVAATASRNGSQGLFRNAPADAIARPLQHTPGLVVRRTRWPDIPLEDCSFYNGLAKYPLLHRAWVFQERRMSRRMVHFTVAQLVWECQHCIEGEDGATMNPARWERTQTYSEEESALQVTNWQKIVREYTQLHSTFRSDRLPAIAAVVEEELKVRPSDLYLAGMWKSSLLVDLLWKRPNSMVIQAAGPRVAPSPPSWSWASVSGRVEYESISTYFEGVQISDIAFTPKGPPQLGAYSEGCITLKAPIVEVTLPESCLEMGDLFKYWFGACVLEIFQPPVYVHGDTVDFDFLGGEDSRARSDRYFFALLGLTIPTGLSGQPKGWGLTLRQRYDTEFERVGTCYCDVSEDQTNWVKEQAIRQFVDSLTVKEMRIM